MSLAILLLSIVAAIVAVIGIVRAAKAGPPGEPWACIGVLLLAVCNIIVNAAALK